MTKEKAKHLAEIFNAYAEGKTIEVFLDGDWCEITSDGFDFDVENDSYRIKKTPNYRPFKNAKECLEEMQKHKPVGCIRRDNAFVQFVSINDCSIAIWTGYSPYFYRRYEFKEAINNRITFADGQPFGIKE